MKRIGKVVWSEGMFLTPHLLQQGDRYHEHLLHFRLKTLSPFYWGLADLEIDREALANGQVTLLRCRGILPDGLPIQIPDADDAPESRSIKDHFSPTVDKVDVYLAIPASRLGSVNFQPPGGGAGRPVRYHTELVRASDETSEGNENEVPVARKNFRLLYSGESLDDTTWIKIGQIGRTPSARFELDEAYISPSVSLTASTKLMSVLRDLLELVSAKSRMLSQQRRHVADFGASDMANFWLLHTVNSSIPALAHFFNAPDRHPEHLYLALSELASQLCTFALQTDPRELPGYDHENLGQTFGELERKIRLLLETVIPTRYVLIPLEKTRESVYVGRIQDERLLKTGQFYLGAHAQVPAARLVEEIPAKAKISSPDQISDLIGRAVRGVELSHEPVPPSAIPVRAGFRYFHLNPHGRFWEGISRSKGLAIYLPDEFPDIKLELVVIKE
jgi:type VI secretion system protein ImpJ